MSTRTWRRKFVRSSARQTIRRRATVLLTSGITVGVRRVGISKFGCSKNRAGGDGIPAEICDETKQRDYRREPGFIDRNRFGVWLRCGRFQRWDAWRIPILAAEAVVTPMNHARVWPLAIRQVEDPNSGVAGGGAGTTIVCGAARERPGQATDRRAAARRRRNNNANHRQQIRRA